MIEFENICKRFDGKAVVEGISGVFHEGLSNLIIGGSGTGKTVLVKCIVGLLQPNAGTITYGGRRFRGHLRNATTREIRHEIGMLFQGSALFDSKKVEENVRFPLDILTRMTPGEKRRRVAFCLERVGLTGTEAKMPSELSGGMKKRVGIARAIVNQSRYLFCDEPNSGLDPQTAIRIDQLISEITKEFNITTVVITHDMNSVMEIGDHILFIHDGRKRWEGNKDSILHTDNEALRDFVFASKLARNMYEESQATTSGGQAGSP